MADSFDILGRIDLTTTRALTAAERVEHDRAKLREAAIEFESLFIKQMLDSMRNTRNKENRLVDGGMTEDIFEDMLYTEYSRTMARNGSIGLARIIEDQLSRRAEAALVSPSEAYK